MFCNCTVGPAVVGEIDNLVNIVADVELVGDKKFIDPEVPPTAPDPDCMLTLPPPLAAPPPALNAVM